MATFLVLYRGESVNSAKLIGISMDADVVKRFAAELLDDPHYGEDTSPDPVIRALNGGKRHALRLISETEGIAR